MSDFDGLKLRGEEAFRLDVQVDLRYLSKSQLRPSQVLYLYKYNVCIRSKDYTEAQRLYEKCLRKRPTHVTTLSNLAQVHINLKNFCNALVHAQNGLNLEPNHLKCLYRCGVAHIHLGNYNEALLCLQKAKQLVRSCKAFCVLMGCALLMHSVRGLPE